MSNRNNIASLKFILPVLVIASAGFFATQSPNVSFLKAPQANSCSTDVCQDPESEGAQIYIALQPNSPEIAQLTEDFVYSVLRQAKRKQTFDIDLLNGNKSHILRSGSATRKDLGELVKQFDPNEKTVEIEPTSSTDLALIHSFNRFKNLAISNADRRPFAAYLVTSGTSDPNTIASIHQICQQLAQSGRTQKVRIYLIGLAPENRLNMTSALHPLASNSDSASASYNEWIELVKKL